MSELFQCVSWFSDVLVPKSPVYDVHWYLSSSSMFLTTLASSGLPFSLMNTLQFVVHVNLVQSGFVFSIDNVVAVHFGPYGVEESGHLLFR